MGKGKQRSNFSSKKPQKVSTYHFSDEGIKTVNPTEGKRVRMELSRGSVQYPGSDLSYAAYLDARRGTARDEAQDEFSRGHCPNGINTPVHERLPQKSLPGGVFQPLEGNYGGVRQP